jgi:hypothetical protein
MQFRFFGFRRFNQRGQSFCKLSIRHSCHDPACTSAAPRYGGNRSSGTAPTLRRSYSESRQ